MRQFYHFLVKIGINPIAFFSFLFGLPTFIKDYRAFKKQLGKDPEFPFGSLYPILSDKRTENGKIRGAYFHQDLSVARKLYRKNPDKHIDVGSRVDGFVAHVAVFREIEVFDVRPQTDEIKNITLRQVDFMNIPDEMVNYCDSVSSLHAIEHFGLGRYGDPIDAYGHVKGIDNIYRVLKPGGTFYFSVPIGKQRIDFNAHRIFDVSYLLKLLEPKFDVVSFSYIDDSFDLFEDVTLEDEMIKKNYGCYYGCGIFELVKK
jgi:SAM-dependent methyltransferase